MLIVMAYWKFLAVSLSLVNDIHHTPIIQATMGNIAELDIMEHGLVGDLFHIINSRARCG